MSGLSPNSRSDSRADSAVGVRDCGCVTAWISLEHSTKREIKEFYSEMAESGREVRRVMLHEYIDRLGPCSHKEGVNA